MLLDHLRRLCIFSVTGSSIEEMESFALWLLPELTKAVDFRCRHDTGKTHVRLLRGTSMKLGYLQILWVPTHLSLPKGQPHLLQNLTSLRIHCRVSHSEWRRILQDCAKSVKHLSMDLSRRREDEDITSLQFPVLEVFQLDDSNEQFPAWMSAPSSLKLNTEWIHSGVP